jgi:hypothetical protein
MRKLIAAMLVATASLAVAADNKPGPPAVVTIETRDLKVEFAGDRAWTIQRIFYTGELVADKNGFYGTVFAAESGKWIGTGHTEGGVEQVEEVTLTVDGQPRDLVDKASYHGQLTVDGQPRDLVDKASYRGQRAEIHKRSMMGPLRLEATYVVTDDAVLERHRYEATTDVQISTLYAFMHAWLPRTTEWMAELGDGSIIDGKFDNSGDFKLKQDPKWTGIYDPVNHRAMLAWYPVPLAGQGIKAGYWDKTVYHKLYNQIYSHAALPAGTKFEAAVILRGVEAEAGNWKDAAKTRAAETASRYERGEIRF